MLYMQNIYRALKISIILILNLSKSQLYCFITSLLAVSKALLTRTTLRILCKLGALGRSQHTAV